MKDEFFKILKFALGGNYRDRRIWYLIKDYYKKHDLTDDIIISRMEANDAQKSDEECTLPVVVQQRELLIDFCEVYAQGQFEDPDDTEGIVDWYMRVKDN